MTEPAPPPAIGFELRRVRAANAIAAFAHDLIDQAELRLRLYALGYTEAMVKAEIEQHSCIGRPMARLVKS